MPRRGKEEARLLLTRLNFFGISIVERANKIRMPSQGQLAIVDDAVVAPIENQNKDSISVFVPASSAQALSRRLA